MATGSTPGDAWTRAEIEATVLIYFKMLRMQELGQAFNKAAFNRQLLQELPARTRGSIEWKHQNISSVLHGLGAQAISGYKPRNNFQWLLAEVVAEMLVADKALDEATIRSVERPAERPAIGDFAGFQVEVPKSPLRVNDVVASSMQRMPIKRDYLEREARNRSLGNAGELLIMEYEARRLFQEGAKHLSDRIEHISQSKGDGLGFDILSFDADGRERYIEVKTTSYDSQTPFFISPNELEFSQENSTQFHLYRLFAFRKKPRMFDLAGPVDMHCTLEEASYRASLLTK